MFCVLKKCHSLVKKTHFLLTARRIKRQRRKTQKTSKSGERLISKAGDTLSLKYHRWKISAFIQIEIA